MKQMDNINLQKKCKRVDGITEMRKFLKAQMGNSGDIWFSPSKVSDNKKRQKGMIKREADMKHIITITDAEIKKIASEYSMTKKRIEWSRINNFVSGMKYMRDFLNLK